jgi:4-carboxymuconolactone decarboxylase
MSIPARAAVVSETPASFTEARARLQAARAPGWTLATALLGFFMVTLDAVIVNVALPDIRRELAGGMSGLQWIVDGYTLMFAALLLSSGSLSDRVGARRAFGAGMAQAEHPSGAGRTFGDFAPGLVGFTDDVLFGQVWTRPDLEPRDRSLVTVAALTAAGSAEQLTYHLGLACQNGVTESELIEAITHLAFYAGWPKAMAAMAVAKQVFAS